MSILEIIVLSSLALTGVVFVAVMVVTQFVSSETIEKISKFFGWS